MTIALWILSGFISWLIVRGMIIIDDSAYKHLRRWKGTFWEEYCEVSFSGLIWLVIFGALGPISAISVLSGAVITFINTIDRVDFSWLGNRAFNLCFWRQK